MIKLSVVIPTFNEEKNISRCVESVRDIADEIFVVDSFSTDSTKEICQNLGVRFVENEYLGMISQRNWGSENAKHDHILALDADEFVSKELSDEIQSIKENWDADAFYLKRFNKMYGHWTKHSGMYPDKVLRLFNRKTAKARGIEPHDSIELNSPGEVKTLKNDLIHYTYEHLSDMFRKQTKYSEISAKSKFDKNKKVNLLKLIFAPLWEFILKYFIRGGIKGGVHGFTLCIYLAIFKFYKYHSLYELNRRSKSNQTQ